MRRGASATGVHPHEGAEHAHPKQAAASGPHPQVGSKLGRVWAIAGAVLGWIYFLIPGFFAVRSYARWRRGMIPRPVFAWTMAWIAVPSLFLAAGMELSLTHDLLAANFESGAGPFLTGTHNGYTREVSGGTYRIVSHSDEGPSITAAPLARTAYVVDLTARLVSVEGAGASRAKVGLTCLNRGEGWGYGFTVSLADGSVEIVGFDGDAQRTLATTGPRSAWMGPQPRNLRLLCAIADPFSDALDVAAYIDGAEVASAGGSSGRTGIASIGLIFDGTSDTAARFDDVVARVP